jgi:Kef-type K+ transport system membrane component KefB
VGGILLGPSLFGLFFPILQTNLFPDSCLVAIRDMSQLGIVLFMFLIGLEFRVDHFRNRLRSAVTVSVIGILMPMSLGGVICLNLKGNHALFRPTDSPWVPVIFLGVAMSVTAFPVMSRMIAERGMVATSLGTLALAAGAIGDAAAWCLLVVVSAIASGNFKIVFFAVIGGLLYVTFVFIVGKRACSWLAEIAKRGGRSNGGLFTFVVILLLLGSWYTPVIGIYEVSGAFILGTATPRGTFSSEFKRSVEPLTLNFLLPLFFFLFRDEHQSRLD